MKKIPTLFMRNEGDHTVRDEVTPGCWWVIEGEGVATRKWDGTCCLIRDGNLFKRYTLRRHREIPTGFVAAVIFDDERGKQEGWLPVGDVPEDKWHRAAFDGLTFRNGTYELCGPHFQANPEGFTEDTFIRHGCDELPEAPRTFGALCVYLRETPIEGIVWWHPDGRMAKIKGTDFGIARTKLTKGRTDG